ncbi:hypothetical protein [Polyangium sorediatum]|uniref:Lipoprotein n=1 Tax=Polyangium sorediatum TaxID=889274 RepID=A0ABT6NPS9_9BACT|nr:hypothetical protein [Polyangium sorediatum]MDI1430217.1 hypothetical protein [Polyangium sorediatum]
MGKTNCVHRTVFLASAVMAVLVTGLNGCSEGRVTYRPIDGEGGGTPDAGADASDSGDEDADVPSTDGVVDCDFQCLGDCAPFRPAGFTFPFLAWIGPNDGTAPDCPDAAPVEQFTWHAELVIPPKKCGPCSCGPSSGTCTLPTNITAHAATCWPPEGTIATPTNPPAAWDGSCAAEQAIPAGLSCGPGVPCVQSVTISPLGVEGEACAAIDPSSNTTTAPTKPSWSSLVRVCEGSAFGACDSDEHCIPAEQNGYRHCVERLGIHACPDVDYTERFIVYDSFEDQRMCSPCTCGAPEGSSCSAWITLYEDAVCSAKTFNISVSSSKPTCLDINPEGQGIAAKTAKAPTYHSGVCEASGGVPSGEVVLAGPRTLCCRP